MIDFRNPYTPGAGMMPKYLAGREQIIADAQTRLLTASTGYQFRSVVYYGLRGVGKTVLLNAIESQAEDEGILFYHIEVKEASNFTKALSIACNGFVKKLSFKETLKDKVSKMVAVAKCFSTTWNPEDQTFSFELGTPQFDTTMSGTGDLANDLTELLVALGRYAKQADTAISFCIDEIQYAKDDELEALITAVHRLNQLGLPVIFFCAGLPKILKTMGDTKSYTERLFEFIEIGSLSKEAVVDAIKVPASRLGVEYTADSIELILDITKGYPYFIQETCSTIWRNHNTKLITKEVVECNISETNRKLDEGFFKVRYDRCTPAERTFIAAMVKCNKLPCTIANVAEQMERQSKSISPTRGKLISKGLIYATKHGEIDFTVPQFDEFIKRHHPDFQT